MATLQTEPIGYSAAGIEMQGHLAWDTSFSGERPLVLVAPEWWGCNDYACARAEQLASLGYLGLAVDLYGGARVADTPDEAGALMTALVEDMATTRSRFSAALEAGKAHAQADGSRTGAIGFCFGGGVVTHMARAGADLDVVASFHGSLGLAVTDGPDQFTARVAAYNGEQDVLVAAEDIAAFEAEMRKAGAHYYLVQLPGALHGFSNPAATAKGEQYGLPLAYDALADATAWSHLQLLLQDVFKDPSPGP
jgi:dienelactone hydrolase